MVLAGFQTPFVAVIFLLSLITMKREIRSHKMSHSLSDSHIHFSRITQHKEFVLLCQCQVFSMATKNWRDRTSIVK